MIKFVIIFIIFFPLTAVADIKYENLCEKEETKENPHCRSVGDFVFLKKPGGGIEYWFKVVGIVKLNKGDVIYKGKVAPADEYYFICEVESDNKSDEDNKEYFLKPVSSENIVVFPNNTQT